MLSRKIFVVKILSYDTLKKGSISCLKGKESTKLKQN